MKLTVEDRKTGGKGVINKLRREGGIPAVIYGLGKEGASVAVKAEAIQKVLRTIPRGQLATTVFELDHAGKKVKAIIKDVQYHFATYNIEHIDFLEMKDDQPVTINVPIELHGVADCAGVKLGGSLRQVIRSVKVSCLPKDIPENFVINVVDLSLGQSKSLSDIEIPKAIRPLVKLNQVVAIVGKKAGA